MSTSAMKKIETVADYFDVNKYVYLSGVLSKEECDRLTKYLFKLKDDGKLIQDQQCPLSWSVYGDPELDSILAQLAEPLSNQLGIHLLPTYTYARIYQPGEVLKRHIDRESCEISGTLTLGHDFESEIWPIHFSHDPKDQTGKSVNIDIGDMVMYRGNELNHWRPTYIGRWQAQVFFHFVDANGPHANWANDGRESLGAQKTINEKTFIDELVNKTVPNVIELKTSQNMPSIEDAVKKNIVYNGIMLPDIDESNPGLTSFHSKFKPHLTFTKDECNKIIEYAKNKYPQKALVGAGEDGTYKEEIRRVDQFVIDLNPNTKWIYDRLALAISVANNEYFKFDIAGITHELQLLHYKSDDQGFYDWHTDTGPGHAAKRKISLVAMLSDKSDYEGGELIVNNFGTKITANHEIGAINMFPSYALHTVTPVIKGNRWVLVIWVHGNRRFA